jgi:hypothetical protein
MLGYPLEGEGFVDRREDIGYFGFQGVRINYISEYTKWLGSHLSKLNYFCKYSDLRIPILFNLYSNEVLTQPIP